MSWPPHPYFQESCWGFLGFCFFGWFGLVGLVFFFCLFFPTAVLITTEVWGKHPIAKKHLSYSQTRALQRESSSAWLMGIN